jgi:CheY-like chemotaxis protein
MAPPRILVVEDDPVNLMVITRMLRRLGHEADIARDGLEAVRAATAVSYDIIFMDIMMPELDGIQAARRIRGGDGGEAPMIFAVTANVMPEDRNACFEAGMNDFVTKPIRLSTIRDLVESGPTANPGTSDAVDLQTLAHLRDMMGDPEFFAELMAEFVRNSNELIDEMEQAVSTGDLVTAGRAAHSLRSSSATFGGNKLSQIAAGAEAAAREGRGKDLPAMLNRLRRARTRVCSALESS